MAVIKLEKKNQEPTEGLCLSIWRRTDIIRGGLRWNATA